MIDKDMAEKWGAVWRYGFKGEHFGLMKGGSYVHYDTANGIITDQQRQIDELKAELANFRPATPYERWN